MHTTGDEINGAESVTLYMQVFIKNHREISLRSSNETNKMKATKGYESKAAN